jgi:nucleoside 2-deoxyribosyltransferase
MMSMTPKRIYLAGPEVFLANAKEVGEQKKTLCRKYGFEGVFPLDNEVDAKNKSAKEVGLCISEVNENLIRTCGILIANITPFRGPSVDAGTAYEMGFVHALGKKVFAYTNVVVPFTERTIKALNMEVNRGSDGKLRDIHGMFIEEMDLTDNLMIDGCIYASSKRLVIEEVLPTNCSLTLADSKNASKLPKKSEPQSANLLKTFKWQFCSYDISVHS